MVAKLLKETMSHIGCIVGDCSGKSQCGNGRCGERDIN